MSCPCDHIDAGKQPGCPCDIRVHPPALRIPAGLSHLPRQVATFPEFRSAMLGSLRSHHALRGWRAREQDDLGVMLLEMWACVCDSLSFYDEIIANETYLRTALRRPSLRRLVQLLGYLPRPAVASFAKLAAFADGRQPVKLPAGTAFRSGAFDGEPPQVFELDVETFIHPLLNKWSVKPPVPLRVGLDNPDCLYVEPRAEIVAGALLLLTDSNNPAQTQAAVVSRVETEISIDKRVLTKVFFSPNLSLSKNTRLAGLRLMRPTQSAGLRTLGASPANLASDGSVKSLTLDNLYREIYPEDYVLVSTSGGHRRYRVSTVEEVMRNATLPNEMTVNGKTHTITSQAPFTKLTFVNTAPGSMGSSHTAFIGNLPKIVRFGMRDAGAVTRPADTMLLPGNAPLRFSGAVEQPTNGQEPQRFFLEDKNKVGLELGGKIRYAPSPRMEVTDRTTWQHPLTLPVEVFGNLIGVSRGEKVDNEILGSGDASLASQSFKLKKKPLTYLPAPTADNDQGVKSTLSIYVNGIRWSEAASFFGKKEYDPAYIVRQNDEGDTWVTFGDGKRGERLPSGRDNVVAHYRFGAGAASPPAGSINQVGKPAAGLQSVKNPLAAFGGADAESAEKIRACAPKSALILGRAVSIQDMEAVVGAVPGVRAAQAEWRWHGGQQRPLAHIWFVGEEGIAELVRQRLKNVSEDTAPIHAELATGVPATLSIDIAIDPRHLEKDVLAAVRLALTNPETGLLAPENIGIGRALFRSQIFDAVLEVPGTTAVHGIYMDSEAFSSYGKKPDAGKYFDLEKGTLLLNGKRTEA